MNYTFVWTICIIGFKIVYTQYIFGGFKELKFIKIPFFDKPEHMQSI